jgi:hypothetical protein
MMQASPANSFPFSPLEFAILFIALWCLISFMAHSMDEIRMSRAKYLWVWPVVFFRLGNEEPLRSPAPLQ